MGACCRAGLGGIFPFAGAKKSPLSIRDSTERGMQGQREGEVYMWIREAGIPLIGKSLSIDQIFRISHPFCWSFPQAWRRNLHASFSPFPAVRPARPSPRLFRKSFSFIVLALSQCPAWAQRFTAPPPQNCAALHVITRLRRGYFRPLPSRSGCGMRRRFSSSSAGRGSKNSHARLQGTKAPLSPGCLPCFRVMDAV